MSAVLSRDELAFHARVVAQMSAAQAVYRAWSEHITAKYDLAQGDMVDEAGQIKRAPRDEAASWADAAGTEVSP